MDGQHQYEITLKKDDLFINLSSDDVYFISKQMDKWFRILLDDSYVPVTLPSYPQPVQPVAQAAPVPMPEPQPVPQPAPVTAAPPYEPQPVAQPQAEPQPQPMVQPVAQPPAQPIAPAPVVAPQPVPQPVPVAAQMADVNLPMAQPQQAVPPVQQPMPQPVPPQPVLPQQAALELQPVAQAAPAMAMAPQPGSPDFEAVMDSVMKDLEGPDEDTLVVPDYAPIHPSMPTGLVQGGFEEPDLSFVTSLADLCDRSNAGNSDDYLLLSAYYLTRVERQEAFSLKKINSVLVKSGLTPINHSVLESVLSRGHLAMVPDLTGTADVSEYAITSDGRDAAIQLL
jgi:hypothetical protein